MKTVFRRTGFVLLAVVALAAILLSFAGAPDGDWPAYGRDPGGQRFSPLALVNRQNVTSLQVAWIYHTGDGYQPEHGRATSFEATPLYVDGTLYLATPLGHVVALDPLTGKARWSFDAKVPRDKGYGDFASRGVSLWKSASGARRVFVATIDARLIALDAATGKTVPILVTTGGEFAGRIAYSRSSRTDFSDYEETSPPAIVGNTLVVGSAIADKVSAAQPSGEVRASTPLPEN